MSTLKLTDTEMFFLMGKTSGPWPRNQKVS